MYARKADFQHGALLSVFINSGMTPALLEQGDKRNLYSLHTDRGSYTVYSKYRIKQINNFDRINWNFSFSEAEIQEIQEKLSNGEKLLFAFTCSAFSESRERYELAAVFPNELEKCIDISNESTGGKRLNVLYQKSHKGLQLYGSDRADKIENELNTIRVERDRIRHI
jgi:hypothetical protein